MKKLTYKILKNEETHERPKVRFDREFYLNELKKEIGLPEVPYEELGKYKVQLNSPTGRSCSFEINANEYVDKELLNIKKSIDDENEKADDVVTFDIVSVMVDETQEKMFRSSIEKSDDFWEWIEETAPLAEVKMEQPVDNFKYFDVKVNDAHYTVVIFNDGTQDIKDQINLVRKHFLTVNERKRNTLTGLEFIINYYQWVNLVSTVEKKPDYLSYEDISKRMDTIFTGVEGLDIPEGF